MLVEMFAFTLPALKLLPELSIEGSIRGFREAIAMGCVRAIAVEFDMA